MAFAASFPELDVAVIQVADLSDGCIAGLADQTYFTRRHTDLSKIAFLG
jgi:hypothetical protein